MTDFIMLSKNEYELRKNDIVLSSSDVQDLLEYRDVIVKFLLKTHFSYKIELCKGTFKGKENDLYRSMATIEETIKTLEDLESTYKNYMEENENNNK